MTEERTEEEARTQTLLQYRDVVSRVMTFLRSREVRDGYASVSLEELIDRRIEDIEGPPIDEHRLKKPQLDRLNELHKLFTDSIEGLKEIPAESFKRSDPKEDANTPEDPDDG